MCWWCKWLLINHLYHQNSAFINLSGETCRLEHIYILKSMKAGLLHDLLTGDRRVTALLDQRQGVTA